MTHAPKRVCCCGTVLAWITVRCWCCGAVRPYGPRGHAIHVQNRRDARRRAVLELVAADHRARSHGPYNVSDRAVGQR